MSVNKARSERRYGGPSIGFESDKNIPLRDLDILDVNDGFKADEFWHDWIEEHLSEQTRGTMWIEDRDDVRFRFDRRSTAPSITCYAPAMMFLGEEKPADVYRGLRREMYVYAAKKAGWPEPPPVPTYRETPRPAKKRKKKRKS